MTFRPYPKSHQARAKVTEPKPVKQRAFNSTLPVSTKPMNKISEKQLKRIEHDGFCAQVCLERDQFLCRVHLALSGGHDRHYAEVVHHIDRKRTHKGVDTRFLTGHQISVCHAGHDDCHSRRLQSDVIKIDVIEHEENSTVTWAITQHGNTVEVPGVSNYNPFEGED